MIEENTISLNLEGIKEELEKNKIKYNELKEQIDFFKLKIDSKVNLINYSNQKLEAINEIKYKIFHKKQISISRKEILEEINEFKYEINKYELRIAELSEELRQIRENLELLEIKLGISDQNNTIEEKTKVLVRSINK